MKNKMLIIEDDVTVSKVLAEFLMKSGFNTVSTSRAEEGIEILNKEKINLVLTDIELPGLDGITFTKQIQSKHNVDVIVMTAYSSKYSYEDAINSGASDLIFKPIRYNELLLRINRVLTERSLINERDKVIKELKRLTIVDSLTTLFNSRHFFSQLEKEIKRSDRYLHPLSLIFIDIDYFKLVNDTYGHIIGDKILFAIAKIIKNCLRSNDTAYRFAGDEFTIILPETKEEKARLVAERIKSKVGNERLVIDDNQISKISISTGIAEFQKNENMEQFVQRADIIMYNEKKVRRNTVISSPATNQVSHNLSSINP